jgi:hypothetical protein
VFLLCLSGVEQEQMWGFQLSHLALSVRQVVAASTGDVSTHVLEVIDACVVQCDVLIRCS